MAEAANWFVNSIPGFFNALWVLTVLVLAPLALFERTRHFAADSLFLVAFLCAPVLVIASAIIVYLAWGTMAMIVGLWWVGIGVVLMASAVVIAYGTPAEVVLLLEYIALPLVTIVAGLRLGLKLPPPPQPHNVVPFKRL